MSGKRIKDLTTASSITNNDYLGMDNANNSAAKKISAMPLLNVNAIANIQNNLVANKAYVIGDQFVYQGNVYKATASIASGATITINGNCALVDSLADQVTQINASLSKIDTTSINTTITGNAYIGNVTIYLYREGQLVYITFDGTRQTYGVPIGIVLANVPEQYRPKHNQMIPAITLSTDGGGAIAEAHCTISPNGNFVMDMNVTAANSIDAGRTYNRMMVRATYSLL